MKRVIFIVLLLTFIVEKSIAQMGAAATVKWDIDRKMDIPLERDSVWALLKNSSLVGVLSNGYVKSIVNRDNGLPILREVTFKDGSKREELLSQRDEQYKFLVYEIKDKYIPRGLTSAQVAIFTNAKNGKETEINWKVKLEGDRDAKKKYIETLNTEIEQYTSGLRNYLTSEPKVIPAVRMK